MRLGVHELLGEFEERDLLGGHHQAEVLALEHEDHAVLEAVGHRLLADQRPLLGQPALLVVLDGGAGRQVPLQEGLRDRGASPTVVWGFLEVGNGPLVVVWGFVFWRVEFGVFWGWERDVRL